MKLSVCFLISAALIGCGGNPEYVGAEAPEGGPTDAHPYMGPICCQVTDNLVDDPYWNDGLYVCDPDAGISSITVGGNTVPWVCGQDDGGVVFACDDPRCTIGSWCNGFNGYGHVTNCQDN